MDPGRQKFQNSQNRMKPMPSRRAHRADSDNMFFFFFLKMDIVCESYDDLNLFSNRQKSQSQ
jgi:hypothetical protein